MSIEAEMEQFQKAWNDENLLEKMKTCTKKLEPLRPVKSTLPSTNFAALIQLLFSIFSKQQILWEISRMVSSNIYIVKMKTNNTSCNDFFEIIAF